MDTWFRLLKLEKDSIQITIFSPHSLWNKFEKWMKYINTSDSVQSLLQTLLLISGVWYWNSLPFPRFQFKKRLVLNKWKIVLFLLMVSGKLFLCYFDEIFPKTFTYRWYKMRMMIMIMVMMAKMETIHLNISLLNDLHLY